MALSGLPFPSQDMGNEISHLTSVCWYLSWNRSQHVKKEALSNVVQEKGINSAAGLESRLQLVENILFLLLKLFKWLLLFFFSSNDNVTQCL